MENRNIKRIDISKKSFLQKGADLKNTGERSLFTREHIKRKYKFILREDRMCGKQECHELYARCGRVMDGRKLLQIS